MPASSALFVFAQPLHARENVAGVAAARAAGTASSSALALSALLDHRRARAADRQIRCRRGGWRRACRLRCRRHRSAAPCAPCGRRGVSMPPNISSTLLSTSALQSSLRQASRTSAVGAGAVAFGEQRARQHVAALGGDRLMVGEKGEHGGVVELVVPQRVLGAAAEQRRVRPARIGVHESGVALEARLGVVAAQDRPIRRACGRPDR